MISNAVLIRGTVVIGIVVADESLTGFLARTDTLLRILFGILGAVLNQGMHVFDDKLIFCISLVIL